MIIRDYDGIVSIVPVINWTGLFHSFVRNSVPQFDDWLDASKTPLIAKATADDCDALDGLRDGVINNWSALRNSSRPTVMSEVQSEAR